MQTNNKFLPVLATLVAAAAGPAFAADETCSDADHILQITAAEVTCFTMDTLMEIDQSVIETSTLWTEGVHVFTGVSLDRLMQHINAKGSEIKATAINDYAITIPMEDAVENGPIVAYAMDGEPMSRRDKGPLWVVYPYDSAPKFRTETIYSRSIWQLNRLEITE